MYWVDNPIWLAGTLAITAIATFGAFFVTLSLARQYVFGLIFIWAGIATVITALKFGKWAAIGGAVLRVVLMAFFTLTVIFYSATLGLVISMVTFTYVLIFPAVIRLRYKYPDIRRPYRIPGGTIGLWVAGILTTAWAALTTVAVV